VLAAAGLRRLGLLDGTGGVPLEPAVMTPAPGQGALAVECRTDDADLRAALELLEDRTTRLAVTAERVVLADLEAGCAAPLGALGSVIGDHLHLDVVVLRPDGTDQIRTSAAVPLPPDPADQHEAALALGQDVARRMLAAGASELGG
ncbi:porphobilinogen deaminase, partial [Cellulomonas bogoriensis 69B4 = DSM 16987]